MNSRGVLLQVSCALLWLLPGCSSPQTVPDKGESVFVVHGLGRTPASMRVLVSRIEDELRRRGTRQGSLVEHEEERSR